MNSQLDQPRPAAVQLGHAGRLSRQDRVLGGQHRAAVELRARRLGEFNSTTTVHRRHDGRIAPGSPDAAVDLIDQNFFGGEMPLVDAHRALGLLKARHVQRRARARDDRPRDQRQRLPVVLTRSVDDGRPTRQSTAVARSTTSSRGASSSRRRAGMSRGGVLPGVAAEGRHVEERTPRTATSSCRCSCAAARTA